MVQCINKLKFNIMKKYQLKTIWIVLLFLFSSVSFLFAQEIKLSQTTEFIPSSKSSKSSVLYAQDDTEVSGWASQDFEAPNDNYDCEGVDDFIVPAGGWNITEIEVFGTGNPGPFDIVNVQFYNDVVGFPDNIPMQSFMNITTVVDNSGVLYISLPPGGISLSAGHYWFSVQNASPYDPSGQWFWSKNTNIVNHISHWRNPLNGFGTGAVNWTPVDIAFGESHDFSFILYGDSADPLVPLSSWSIIISLFLISLVFLYKYRRSFI